jgi:hypothetical protein
MRYADDGHLKIDNNAAEPLNRLDRDPYLRHVLAPMRRNSPWHRGPYHSCSARHGDPGASPFRFVRQHMKHILSDIH